MSFLIQVLHLPFFNYNFFCILIMGNSIDMYAKAFHGSEIVSLTDVEEPECKALLYLSRYDK